MKRLANEQYQRSAVVTSIRMAGKDNVRTKEEGTLTYEELKGCEKLNMSKCAKAAKGGKLNSWKGEHAKR